MQLQLKCTATKLNQDLYNNKTKMYNK